MNGKFSEETLSTYLELVEERFGASFSESEYDFTRCMRADGSFYGTRGECRKGSDAGAAEKKGSGIIGSATPAQRAAMENRATQMRIQNAQADRAAIARKVAKEMGKDPTSVEVAKEVGKRQEQMAKKRALYQEVSSRKSAWLSAQENLKKTQTQLSKVKKAVGKRKGPEAWELMQKANAALEKAEKQELKARDRYFSSAKRAGASFSESGEYDFTRCMRADGSIYGTGGKCRKGTEATPAEEKTPPQRARNKSGYGQSDTERLQTLVGKLHRRASDLESSIKRAKEGPYKTKIKEKIQRLREKQARLQEAKYRLQQANPPKGEGFGNVPEYLRSSRD